MEHMVLDYYDVPTEWLPHANFAGRPSQEISDNSFVDGLWAFVASSSSSDAEIAPTFYHELPSESPLQLTLVEKPSILVTAPESYVSKHSNRSRDEGKVYGQQRTRRNAATAPPGSLAPTHYSPQVPRRAISARASLLNANRGKIWRRNRELQVTRAAGDGAVGIQEGVLEQHVRPVGDPTNAPQLAKSKMNEGPLLQVPEAGSFSQKERIQRTLEGKNIENLNTIGANLETRGRRISALSISTTPRELYGTSAPRSSDLLDTNSRSGTIRTPDPGLQKASSCPPPTERRTWKSSKTNESLKQPQAIRASSIYLPGPINLEEHPARLRRDSVATLDPFDKAVESKGQRFSDLVGLDNIVMYFEDLGIVDETSEGCLDRFWLYDSKSASQRLEQSSVSTAEVVVPSSPWTWRHMPSSGSRFSFSSGSSSNSQPRSWATPIRQRIKLKRLLSPALPGSAFHRSQLEVTQPRPSATILETPSQQIKP